MIWLLKFLWFGHAHQWEKVDEAKIKNIETGEVKHRRYYCRCVKCGAFRAFNCF
jgi:hypothetical protein